MGLWVVGKTDNQTLTDNETLTGEKALSRPKGKGGGKDFHHVTLLFFFYDF